MMIINDENNAETIQRQKTKQKLKVKNNYSVNISNQRNLIDK